MTPGDGDSEDTGDRTSDGDASVVEKADGDTDDSERGAENADVRADDTDENADDDDDYRFSLEDLEDGSPVDRGVDTAPLVIAACLGLGALLLLSEPLVDPVSVADLELRPAVGAAGVVAAGLLVGSGAYVRRGKRLLGAAHGVGAVGWSLLVFGSLLSSRRLLLTGGAVIAVGAAGLGALAWRSRT